MKRRQRIEQLLLSGVTNKWEIAAAFGLNVLTISSDIRAIQKEWASNEITEEDERRVYRIRQLERLAQMAINSYERSRKDETIHTLSMATCRECDGRGELGEEGDERTCMNCKGRGKTQEETVRVRGQAGDASFLRVAKECFIEAAKLEGLHPGILSATKITKSVHQTQDGQMVEQLEALYVSAPVDALLRAKAALAEVKRQALEQQTKKSLVVDAEPGTVKKVERD